MKKIIKYVLIMCILFNLAGSTTTFAANKSEEMIKTFYNSVTSEGGYINYVIGIVENKNGTYSLNLFIKENITGIELGFFASPSIMKSLEDTDIQYEPYVENKFFYIKGEKIYSSLNEISVDLVQFSFIELVQIDNFIMGSADLTIWDNLMKNNKLIDSIYSTNRYVFSYRPLKISHGNYTGINNGEYVWILENGKKNDIIIETKNSRSSMTTIIILGILVLGGGLFFILGGSINLNKIKMSRDKKKNNSQYGDNYYDDYYDDYNDY
ncbi:hypothetical protein [Alkaliphilus sp. B6464]|uniref:hypothetical protein n=1 Tax=Alkaliphilus sp. B6464 TaxID=2731219 RepID=UPI001BABF061|nr:hypothetical protein [Alkaliphilus sp. B6464]QUH21966.1 hypothetical protein HYG84_18855 [Alkaliphilus sp. B6464]